MSLVTSSAASDPRSIRREPDPFEDPDHDGMTNLQEYLAGTNPTNALSVLRLNVSLDHGAQRTFFAAPNKTYSLLRRTNLTVSPWTKVFDASAAFTNRWLIFRDTNAPGVYPEGYYRLVTPQAP